MSFVNPEKEKRKFIDSLINQIPYLEFDFEFTKNLWFKIYDTTASHCCIIYLYIVGT